MFESLGTILGNVLDDLQSGRRPSQAGCRKESYELAHEKPLRRDWSEPAPDRWQRQRELSEPPIEIYDES